MKPPGEMPRIKLSFLLIFSSVFLCQTLGFLSFPFSPFPFPFFLSSLSSLSFLPFLFPFPFLLPFPFFPFPFPFPFLFCFLTFEHFNNKGGNSVTKKQLFMMLYLQTRRVKRNSERLFALKEPSLLIRSWLPSLRQSAFPLIALPVFAWSPVFRPSLLPASV